jgi:hypothetical protein
VLAGARHPLDVHTLPSSTTTTLPLVLAGTGARVLTDVVGRNGGARRSARTAAA